MQRLTAGFLQAIPAIVITGEAEPGVPQKDVEQGYTLINKPVEPGILRERIEQLIR